MWIRFLAPPARPEDIPAGASLLALEEGPPAEGSFAHDFADFTAELSRANAGFEWWALGLSTKEPLTVRLPLRCFHFSLIAKRAAAAPADSGLVVVTSDRVLCRQVQSWARGQGIRVSPPPCLWPSWRQALIRWTPLGPVVGLLRALVSLFLTRLSCRFQEESGKAYTVVFTLIGPRSFDEKDGYRDVYFGDLVPALDSPLVLGHVSVSLRSSLRRLSRLKSGFPVVPMDSFLTLGDLLRVFRIAMRRRFFEFPLRGPRVFQGLDVGLLLREEFRENARASRLFAELWYHACAESLLRRVRVKALYYPFENLCRERMFLWAFRARSPGSPLIGYQHAAVTHRHLNFILGRGEADVLPLPDRIVTMGEVTRDFLRDHGRFPPGLLRVGCALRQKLGGAVPARPRAPEPGRPLRLLVITATSFQELVSVIRLLDRTFGDAPQGCPEIRLRPHPMQPLSKGLRLHGPVRFRFRDGSQEPAADAFTWPDAVLYASSTMGVEALAWGLPVVFLDLGAWLSPDPMPDFRAFKWTASDPASLRRALAEITALPPDRLESLRAQAQAYARRYFQAATPQAMEAFLSGASPS